MNDHPTERFFFAFILKISWKSTTIIGARRLESLKFHGHSPNKSLWIYRPPYRDFQQKYCIKQNKENDKQMLIVNCNLIVTILINFLRQLKGELTDVLNFTQKKCLKERSSLAHLSNFL